MLIRLHRAIPTGPRHQWRAYCCEPIVRPQFTPIHAHQLEILDTAGAEQFTQLNEVYISVRCFSLTRCPTTLYHSLVWPRLPSCLQVCIHSVRCVKIVY